MAHSRDLKRALRDILSGDGWAEGLAGLDGVPARRLTGPLFSLLLDPSAVVRWRAVQAFGRTVARMAESPPAEHAPGQGLEAARVVLRQCIWRLNEESGGVGWGVPEALGETLARHRRLALEFHRVLASYVREEEHGEGNSLDHVPLRRGVYWALGRLAQEHPDLLAQEISTLRAGLEEDDGACRGLAAWTLGLLGAGAQAPALEALRGDMAEVELFREGELHATTVGALADEALERLARRG
ncbi:MAG: HEAT repeat domain-containing protein [Proteobacteria bacterium]|nr:HEAT repeat domain-containing protein [Pseudomonadota bacterium]MBU1595989.1 HEAT repeat domain-containing protein [Pseudomonadota bacterium]